MPLTAEAVHTSGLEHIGPAGKLGVNTCTHDSGRARDGHGAGEHVADDGVRALQLGELSSDRHSGLGLAAPAIDVLPALPRLAERLRKNPAHRQASGHHRTAVAIMMTSLRCAWFT
jgi:hypothetical protein